eukprot:4029472-Prorocentrum_lima.AAC.1
MPDWASPRSPPYSEPGASAIFGSHYSGTPVSIFGLSSEAERDRAAAIRHLEAIEQEVQQEQDLASRPV